MSDDGRQDYDAFIPAFLPFIHSMARWLLLLLTFGSLALMLFGPSPGWVGFGVLAFLIGSIATVLAFAQSRIATLARHETTETYRILQGRIPAKSSPSAKPGKTAT